MGSGFSDGLHSEQGFACPRHRFGITDYAELQRFEAPLVAKRGGDLEDFGVTGKFDVQHLPSIRTYLFQDIFRWAGEFRVVNLQKAKSSSGAAMHLHGALQETLAKLQAERHLVELSAAAFLEQSASYLGEINAIHPFRAGNRRTQREFIRQLALQAGHPLSWAGLTQQEMVQASILSHLQGDKSKLATILHRALYTTREQEPST